MSYCCSAQASRRTSHAHPRARGHRQYSHRPVSLRKRGLTPHNQSEPISGVVSEQGPGSESVVRELAILSMVPWPCGCSRRNLHRYDTITILTHACKTARGECVILCAMEIQPPTTKTRPHKWICQLGSVVGVFPQSITKNSRPGIPYFFRGI